MLVTQIAGDYGVSPVMNKSFMNWGFNIRFEINGFYIASTKTKDWRKVPHLQKNVRMEPFLPEYRREGRKSRMFIYEKLKEQGIFPIVERR